MHTRTYTDICSACVCVSVCIAYTAQLGAEPELQVREEMDKEETEEDSNSLFTLHTLLDSYLSFAFSLLVTYPFYARHSFCLLWLLTTLNQIFVVVFWLLMLLLLLLQVLGSAAPSRCLLQPPHTKIIRVRTHTHMHADSQHTYTHTLANRHTATHTHTHTHQHARTPAKQKRSLTRSRFTFSVYVLRVMLSQCTNTQRRRCVNH